MSKYLRDGSLEYLTITVEELDKINEKVTEIFNAANKLIENSFKPMNEEELDKIYNELAKKSGKLKEIVKKELQVKDIEKYFKDTLKDKMLTISYVLRCDGRGVTYCNYEEMKKHFQNARNIERLFINVNSQSNRTLHNGKRIEIGFEKAYGKSYYLVEDDDDIWVEGVVKELMVVFEQFQNRNYFFYSGWLPFFIQITFVILIFLLCIWASNLIAPRLKIENAMLFVFIGFFLIFSNVWTFVFIALKNIIEKKFPMIEFRKKTWAGWLFKGLIIAAIYSLIGWLLKTVWRIL